MLSSICDVHIRLLLLSLFKNIVVTNVEQKRRMQTRSHKTMKKNIVCKLSLQLCLQTLGAVVWFKSLSQTNLCYLGRVKNSFFSLFVLPYFLHLLK